MESDGSREEESLVDFLRQENESVKLDSNRSLQWERSLLKLIEISRRSVGRAKLADLRTVPLFLDLLKQLHTSCLAGQPSNKSSSVPASFSSVLLLLLKLLRNLCAGDALNQDAFLAEEGQLLLVPIATALLSVCKPTHGSKPLEDFSKVRVSTESDAIKLLETRSPKEGDIYVKMQSELEVIGGKEFTTCERALYRGYFSVAASCDCLRMLLQLLGNFCRRGDACIAAVWQEFYPTLLCELASLRSELISDVLSMVLYTCCKGSKERCWQLCQSHGAVLMSILFASADDIHSESRDGGQFDWFELLVRQICLEESLLPLLFTNLGIIPMRQSLDFSKVHTDEYACACQLWLKTCTFTSVQASLLYMVFDCLTYDLEEASNLSEDGKAGLKLFITKDCMVFLLNVLERVASCVAEESDITSVAPVLPMHSGSPAVQVLGCSLLLWRILCTCDPKSEQHVLLTHVLVHHVLLDLLLKMLEALGPPEAPGKKSVVQSGVRARKFSGPGAVPSTMCYQGYRRDIVAVIGNASNQNSVVQDYVREKGKLLLVLQQSTVEMDNPFLREWGLWAMRNLLEGNVLNQKEVSSLELREAVNLPELHNMGLRVEIDSKTRQPRLVNTGSR